MEQNRQKFCDLLNEQTMPSDFGGRILVLRNKNEPYDMAARVETGHALAKAFGGGIIIPIGENTKEEAVWAIKLLDECWNDLLIVTSPKHRYRAFLTFLQQFKHTKVRIVMTPSHAPCPQSELDKIEEYQAKGDVASYEEGIEWLRAT